MNLLLNPNKAGFTPLHQAANSNSVEILNAFLDELEDMLSGEEYMRAINKKTSKGYPPACQRDKSNAKQINQILETERRGKGQAHHDKPLSHKGFFNKNIEVKQSTSDCESQYSN